MREIIVNINNTYIIKMDTYSVTANSVELEQIFNECYEISILELLKKASDNNQLYN